MTVDSQTAARLLRIYGINPPVTDERFAEHHHLDTGIPVTIDAVNDPAAGNCVRLKISGRRSARLCPVTQFEAEGLVAEFHDEHLLSPDEKVDRTLVNLLVKSSKLFTEAGIGELHLVLYVTPQGYRTHAVYMLRTRNLPVRRRLAPDAHDVGAVYPWRRTARQKKPQVK